MASRRNEILGTRYVILGAGMQGTAAAYDLCKFAEPTEVLLCDLNLQQAQKSVERVKTLTGSEAVSAMELNVLASAELDALLLPGDVVVSCVPYWMHPKIAPGVIARGANMVDLGGNTDVTLQTLKMNDSAVKAGVSLVPDCGLAPGLVNSIATAFIEQLDETESVKVYCGVLPQNPKPPFNYKLTFNVEGLVTEYDYQAVVLRNGKIEKVDTLAELETIHLDELGEMEVFTTSGGTSTAPYTFEGKVKNYEYKTIRFPGHCKLMRIFKDFGFWSENVVSVPGGEVKPKDVFCKVFGPSLAAYVDKDFCAIRGIATGTKGGKTVHLQTDLFVKEDESTGFTSMEQLTGTSIAIYAHQIAKGKVEKGCIRYELAMTGTEFLQELEKRGIAIRHSSPA